MNETHRRTLGFTLIEVLIAIALILALMGTMYGFLYDMLWSRSRVLGQVRQETAASALINRLDADLATCIAGDNVFGGGVTGDERSLRILTRSVAAMLASRGVDDADAFGDLQLVEYRFDSTQQRIEARRAPLGRPISSLPDPAPPAAFSPIEGVVNHVRFRYHNGREWTTSFDSLISRRLPLAVEVAIWFHAAPDDVDSESDVPLESLPPDRVRVFLVPDAHGGGEEEAGG